MIKKHQKTRPMHAADPPPAPVQTDPIDVIAQHWADLSGLSRTAALNQLALIGHMTMKANSAGVRELTREMEKAIATTEAAAAAKAAK